MSNFLSDSVWTLTFGEATESHVGMAINGKISSKGYSLEDLKVMKSHFEKLNCECDLIHLNDYLSEKEKKLDPAVDSAYVLVVKEGLRKLIDYDSLCEELHKTKPLVNTKAFMRGAVKNKKARWGYCVGDFSQDPDYENKKGRIIDFKEHPQLSELRKQILSFTGDTLLAEVNYYYDPKKCYIGYHGDRERRKVIGCRLGDSGWPLRFRWHHQSERVGPCIEILLNGGDLYVMSDKAVGTDWLNRKTLTLRHAAGTSGYTK